MSNSRVQKKRERRNLLSKTKRAILRQLGSFSTYTKIDRLIAASEPGGVERTVLRRMRAGGYAKHCVLLQHRWQPGSPITS